MGKSGATLDGLLCQNTALNVVEWGMTVQQAVEAPNRNSVQLRSTFGGHEIKPGHMLLNEQVPAWVRGELASMGDRLEYERLTSGRSTRSSSTGRTTRSGAGPAITARTTGSRGRSG